MGYVKPRLSILSSLQLNPKSNPVNPLTPTSNGTFALLHFSNKQMSADPRFKLAARSSQLSAPKFPTTMSPTAPFPPLSALPPSPDQPAHIGRSSCPPLHRRLVLLSVQDQLLILDPQPVLEGSIIPNLPVSPSATTRRLLVSQTSHFRPQPRSDFLK